MIVGAKQKAAQDRVVAAILHAVEAAPPEFAKLLEREAEKLQRWRARISVVGQIKAGKSTFLGALTRRPRLFPADVNPWTAAITNLFFGHPDDPENGAIFHFFDPADWDRISEGDEAARQTAEKLLPGFRYDLLSEQVAKMQEFARARLGAHYNTLLGGRHHYTSFDDEILSRYVCAGPDKAEMDPMERVGRYACITERADIYLSDGPFATPTVITDTPGLNDPFLVRDELTCRSLSQSDVFVVVLSAQQALTEVDLALIRGLSANPRNRLVIFVNRIDELPDIDFSAPLIVEGVRDRLAEAFPDRAFPIIAGSARWAEIALDTKQNAAEAEGALTRPDVKAFLMELDGATPQGPPAILLKLSGLERIMVALSEAIEDGPGAVEIERCLSRAVALMDVAIAAMAIDAERSEGADDALAGASSIDDALARGEAASARFLADAPGRLRASLIDASRSVIYAQRAVIAEAVSGSEGGGAFKFDFSGLKTTLEAVAAETYESLRGELDASLDMTFGAASSALLAAGGKTRTADFLHSLPGENFTAALPRSDRTLSISLTSAQGAGFWADAGFEADDAANRLGELILWETKSAIDHLALRVQQSLTERAEAASQFCADLDAAMRLRRDAGRSDAAVKTQTAAAMLASLEESRAVLLDSHTVAQSLDVKSRTVREASP